MRWWVRFAALLIASAQPALAQERVPVGPTPAWVTAVTLPAERKTDGAFDFRLLSVQARSVSGGIEVNYHQVVRVLAPEALAGAGNIGIGWKPGVSSVTMNTALIRREGKVIDVLGNGRAFQIMRREANLDRLQLDGVLSALMPVADLRVGDEVDFSWTMRVADPVLAGKSELEWSVPVGVKFGRLHVRTSVAADAPASYRLGAALQSLARKEGSGFIIDRTDVALPLVPVGAPGRFAANNQFTLSSFASWAEVAAAMRPLYAAAATMSAGSSVALEAARIAAQSDDPAVRANAALALVQRQVRYFARTDGLGGYKPESAEAVWTARAGDCKGKTALLVALLTQLGIDAQPALVSVNRSDGIADSLPMPGRFDHVIVRAVVGGRVRWLDGSRLGDRSIDSVAVPDLRHALPINGTGGLVTLDPTLPALPLEDWRLDLDARGGLDQPAKASATLTLRADRATETRAMLNFMSAETRDTFLRKLWTDRHDWITVATVTQSFDETAGEFTLAMTGSGTMDWNTKGATPTRRYEANKARLGQSLTPDRPEGQQSAAPVAIGAQYTAVRQTILLPDAGRGYAIEGEPIDTVAGGVAYQRTATLRDGRFDMVATTKSASGELSFAEAKAADLKTDDVFSKQLFIKLPVVAAPRTAGSRGARKGELLAGSISDEDYPKAALAKNEQGRSTVSFDIGVDGRVAACRVGETSGSDALDQQTCTLVRDRFIFRPAQDRRGRPVPETRVQSVVWRLPKSERSIEPAEWIARYVVDETGTPSECTVESKPKPPKNATECPQLGGTTVKGPDGKPIRARVVQRQSLTIEPLPPPLAMPAKPDAPPISSAPNSDSPR